MIKCKIRTDEGDTVLIGLSDANVNELRKDRPILFSLGALEMDPENVFITYGRPDGKAASPPPGTSVHLGIVLTDDSLDHLETELLERKIRGVRFILARGKTEAEMERDLAPLIGTNTRTKHEGFAPSDIPPSIN